MTALDQIIRPTSERLLAANDNFVVEPGGATRMQDAPMARLFRQAIITAEQHQAGILYFQDWYNAGMAPLGAIDYGKAIVDGSRGDGVSDFRLSAQVRYNKSNTVLGAFFRAVVNAVVLHEQGLEAAGRGIGLNNASQARAVALDRLRGGLDLLVARYGLA